MKIFISVDMEGVAGIVDWAQCRQAGGAAYEVGCALMLGELNAAVEGALEGGADEILVNDSHGAMFNLNPADLPRPARYLSGRHKPGYMMQGLDASFDGAFFVGYHGSISGQPSTLSHTYNPEVISGAYLNGVEVGEAGINALPAEHCGVPIALLTGDAVTHDEITSVAPDVVSVITKQSVSRFAADNLHPEVSRELIRAGAIRAVRAVAAGEIKPPTVSMPASLELQLQTADMAEIASWAKGVERSSTRTVLIQGDDGSAIYRSFVALTYITRQAGGR